MYKRTIGMTLEESDKHRTWIDATLAEVDAQLMSPNSVVITNSVEVLTPKPPRKDKFAR